MFFLTSGFWFLVGGPPGQGLRAQSTPGLPGPPARGQTSKARPPGARGRPGRPAGQSAVERKAGQAGLAGPDQRQAAWGARAAKPAGRPAGQSAVGAQGWLWAGLAGPDRQGQAAWARGRPGRPAGRPARTRNADAEFRVPPSSP